MRIFEIVVPGTWLDYADQDWSWTVRGLLQSLQSQFLEANLALNLFEQAQQESFEHHINRDTWLRDSNRRSEIQRTIEAERGGVFNFVGMDQIRWDTELIFKREQWAAGTIPREFRHKTPFIYARSFLYALDAFDKLLGVISKLEAAPAELAMIHADMARLFPALREVRNSAHHMEDRLRYLGKYGKPLDLKPVDGGGIKASGGALILDNLNGSLFGSTMADGHFGEVDVSSTSMEGLQDILARAYAVFEWRGPQQHYPNA